MHQAHDGTFKLVKSAISPGVGGDVS